MNETPKPRFTPVAPYGAETEGHETGQAFQGHTRVRPSGASVHESGDIDLLQLLGVAWRGKWIILFCAFLAGLIGGYYALEIAVPKYATTARLALQVRDQQVVDLESVVSGVSTEQAAINTELQVIRSRGLLERLVTEMNLIDDPEFNGMLRTPSPFSRAQISKRVRGWFSDAAPEDPDPSAEGILNSVVNSVSAAIGVSAQRNTYLFDIRATTQDPRKSADIANTLAEIYLDDQIGIKFSATEYAVDWLSGRVTELELEFKEKEDAIKNLRAETELVSLDALEALNIRAKDIRDRLSDAQVAVTTTRAKSTRYAALLASKDAIAILAEVSDPALARLANNVAANDFNAINTFFTRFETLAQREATEAARRIAQRDALEASYAQLQQEIKAQNADLAKLNQLVREADATRILYETFLTRLKETSVQIGLQQADSRILSRAIPGQLVAPRKSMILALSLMLGGMLGVGVVFLRQVLHDGYRTAEELEQNTGYRVIGQIPKMPIRRRIGLIDYIQNKPTSAAAEAVRNLRTSILLSNMDAPAQVIMSTSSIPGEGKTTNAISLAHNLCGLGKSVLLIEGDIRRRTLSEYFSQTPPGNLLTVITKEQQLKDAVIHDDRLNMDVLMGTKSATNAADLFSSDMFKDFVDTARNTYDFVIFDTPPVLVVPDARIIGRLCDVIMYAVNWDTTGKAVVTDGLRQFSSVGVDVTGLVLTRIDVRRMKRYGYGGKYGSYAQYGLGYYDA